MEPLRDITPANGGIVVLQDGSDTAPDAHILHGIVLARGGGVAWLGTECRVAFRAGRGALFTVSESTTELPLKGKPYLVTSSGPDHIGGAIVTVIDQRDVLAVLGDPFPGFPGIVASPVARPGVPR